MPTPARSGPSWIPKSPSTVSAATVQTTQETTARPTAVNVEVRLARRGSTTDNDAIPIFDIAETVLNCSRSVNLTMTLVTRRRSHLLTSAAMPTISSERSGFITSQSAPRADNRLCVRFQAASQKNDGAVNVLVRPTSSSVGTSIRPRTFRRICEA